MGGLHDLDPALHDLDPAFHDLDPAFHNLDPALRDLGMDPLTMFIMEQRYMYLP